MSSQNVQVNEFGHFVVFGFKIVLGVDVGCIAIVIRVPW